VERVAAFMERAPRGSKLILCGFSDHREVIPLLSLDLSNLRADQVADMLMRKGVNPYHVRGFGATVAVASEETPAGRNKNRRVEIWIK
jgi:phosphate transport system substrate-binding protein